MHLLFACLVKLTAHSCLGNLLQPFTRCLAVSGYLQLRNRCQRVYPACRGRMHLLFACLVKLNARLRTGRKGPLGHARQLALARAMHDFSEVARNALPSDTDSFLALPDPLDAQFWVSALSGSALSLFLWRTPFFSSLFAPPFPCLSASHNHRTVYRCR